jgi:hypothetical protein
MYFFEAGGRVVSFCGPRRPSSAGLFPPSGGESNAPLTCTVALLLLIVGYDSLNPDGSIDSVRMAAVSPLADSNFDYQDLLLRPAEKK